jgi:hypothetical protein
MFSRTKPPTTFTTTILVFFVLAMSIFPGMVVLAQTTTPVAISSVDISHFPSVSVDIQLSREINSPFPTLATDQVQVSEDGKAILPGSVNKIEPGLQTILALNAGTYMAIDYRLQTLYQHVQMQVLDWLALQSNSVRDDYSFTSNSGPIFSHVADPQILSQSLGGFKPNLLASVPSLQALSSAIAIATEPLPRQTMQRAILYITVLPDRASVQALPSLTAQATSLGVKVFVWLIAPSDLAESPNTLPLIKLAENTGGDFFLYSGPETLPNLENEFSNLRSYFQIQYTSLVRKSGTYDVSVKILGSGNEWNSPVQSFDINLLPPNIFFLSPMTSVHRIWEETPSSKQNILTPSTLTFQIKTEFPDGYPRSFLKTDFLVDGEIIQELTTQPYETFSWDISALENSGVHIIQVQGEDILGFKFQTSKIFVEFVVDPLPISVFSRILGFLTSGPVLATIIGLITIGTIIAIVLRTNRNLSDKKKQPKPVLNFTDPLTQQVDFQTVSKPLNGNSAHPSPTLSLGEKPYARLVRLSEITQDTIPDAIVYITKKDVTLGSDPRVVSIGIPSSSVSPIHARIHLSDSGTFTINDLKSTAGTWVNFAPVSAKGASLENGDLVNIGKLLYRFEVLNRPLV